jgi:hypothetical protein
MWCKPNDSTLYYWVESLNTGLILTSGSTTTTLPTNTAFMGPQVAMSNGANTTVNKAIIDIGKVYVGATI